MSQLHTCLDGETIEEIRIFSSEVVGLWVGTTSSGVLGLAAAVLTHASSLSSLDSRISCYLSH